MAGRSKLRPNGSDKTARCRYVYRRVLRGAAPSTADDKRTELERAILLAAEEEFAKHGFRGTSLEQIASTAGLSKQNMLYYFPTKNDLYSRVLENLLDGWLGSLDIHLGAGCDPLEGVQKYIVEKLRFSRERPAGSRLYAMELIAGAPHFSHAIATRVAPRTLAAANTLANLFRGSPDASLDAVHTVFLLWALTQTYADFSHQMEVVLGRPLGEKDFNTAERLISAMVSSLLVGKQEEENPESSGVRNLQPH